MQSISLQQVYNCSRQIKIKNQNQVFIKLCHKEIKSLNHSISKQQSSKDLRRLKIKIVVQFLDNYQSIMQTSSLAQKTIRSSFTVVNSVIDELIQQSKNQAISSKLISKYMNPFTSEKVNHTINQIGNLIYEEAQDSSQHKKFNHFAQVNSPKYMPKDNLFTNGVAVQIDENSQNSKFNKDDRQSVQSFKTTFSKLQVHVSNFDSAQSANAPVNFNNKITPQKFQENPSKQSQLISLQPQSSGPNKTSAFNRSQTQNIQQKIIEIQINEYRQQKLLEQQNRIKNIQKDKKLTNLLTNDQVIMTFDYQGQIIKKTKRQLAQMLNNKDNQKVAETGLLINDAQKFWKSKNRKNGGSNKLNEPSLSSIGIESSINQLKNKSIKAKESGQKRTTIEKIEELKKRSILVELKKKISASQQKSTDKKGFQMNSITSFGNNGQRTSEQEQAKIKEQQVDFLSKKLVTYHEKQQNFMPKWVQKIEKGCKMTIFIGDGESEKDKAHERQRQRQLQKKTNRSLSDKSERMSRINQSQQKESMQKKTKKNSTLGNLHEVKQIQNLKIGQLSQAEILDEWQKRVTIKSLDSKLNPKNVRKLSSKLKNSRTVSANQTKEISRKNTNINGALESHDESRINISKEIETLNDRSNQLQPSEKIKPNRFDTVQDEDVKSQYSLSNIQLVPKTKLNLNRKEFEKLKNYLKNKNSIVTKNQTIKKDTMEFYLLSQKKPLKHIQTAAKPYQIKPNTCELNSSAYTQSCVQPKLNQNVHQINEEQEESTIHQKRRSQKHKRLLTLPWKPRSFSVNQKIFSPCKSEVKSNITAKLQGSIKISNQKLKHTLLRDTMDFDLSKSSILNKNHGSKSNLKSSSSEIKWELTEKSRLNSIRKSLNKLPSTQSRIQSSKSIEIPQSIVGFKDSGLKQVAGKQTPQTRSTSIVVSKPRKTVTKGNLLKNSIK